jgi:hypothetical protein
MRLSALIAMLGFACLPAGLTAEAGVWTTSGFEAFSRGTFDSGGSNLYVSRAGRLQMIKVWDVNHDGHVDLFFGQSHDLTEYQPALVYHQRDGAPDPKAVVRLPTLHSRSHCVSDLNGDGHVDVVVLNHMTVREPTFRSFIYWGGPEGMKPRHRTGIPTFNARRAFAADLNRDGLKEIIVLNAARHRFDLKGKCISIHWQTASGLFPPDKRDDIVVPSLGAADLADVDGDGFHDLVFQGRPAKDSLTPAAVPVFEAIGSSAEASNIFLLPGKPGGFGAMRPLAVSGDRSGTPRLLDLGGRHYLVMLTPKAIELYPFSGASRRELGAPRRLEIPGVSHVDLGDVNHDGVEDLVCVRSGRIECLLGVKGKPFDLDRARTLKVHASAIAVGDVTGDGRADLVAAMHTDGNRYRAQSRVYINGESGFDSERFVALETHGASDVHIADFDGDGGNDVIFACGMGGFSSLDPPVRVYLGSADGDYRVGRHVDLPAVSANAGFMADYNDDGFTDLLVANQWEGMGNKDTTSPIYWGAADGLSPQRVTKVSTGHGYIPATADINRDGYLDIVMGGVEGTPTWVHWGGVEGFSDERRQAIKLGGIDGTHLADVDKDGWLDLVYVAFQRGETCILLGSSEGFDENRKITLPMPLGGAGVDMADLDGNGWLDLVLTGWSNPRKGFAATRVPSYIWWGSAQGFAAHRRTELGVLVGATHDVAIADLNRDGHLDIVTSNYARGPSRIFDSFIFWGNAEHAYSMQNVTQLRQASAYGIQVADLNHDGWPEITYSNHSTGGDHRTNSRIHWNREGRITDDDVTLLPTLGPHMSIAADLGNDYTRKLEEAYVSEPFEKPARSRYRKVSWEAETRFGTSVVFQVRTAASRTRLDEAAWVGPDGPGTFFTESASKLDNHAAAEDWIQYRAILRTPNGAATPILTRVDVDHE